MRKQLTTAELIANAQQSESASHYHVFPGIVQAYHAGGAGKRPTVDAQFAVNDVRFDLDTGARESEPFDIATDVPVLFLKIGPFSIKGPLSQGDEVTLIAYDLDPSDFRTTGRRSDPPTIQRHNGCHWLALPFGIADPNAGVDPGQDLVIGYEAGEAQIRFTGSKIRLGKTGGDKLALANKVNAMGSALKAFAQGIVPPTPIVVPGTTGVPTVAFAALASALAGAIADVGSALIDAE